MKLQYLLHRKAVQALKSAIKKVVELHRQTGRPLAVWEKGRVIKISAQQAIKMLKKT